MGKKGLDVLKSLLGATRKFTPDSTSVYDRVSGLWRRKKEAELKDIIVFTF